MDEIIAVGEFNLNNVKIIFVVLGKLKVLLLNKIKT